MLAMFAISALLVSISATNFAYAGDSSDDEDRKEKMEKDRELKKELREEYKIKLEEFFIKVKDFNFTRYLLDKKERKIMSEIELNEGLIEHYKEQIVYADFDISTAEEEIERLEKEIKELEKDAKKVVKVINLYIDWDSKN